MVDPLWTYVQSFVVLFFGTLSLVGQDRVIRLAGAPIEPLVREVMKLWQLDRKDPLAVMVNEENKVMEI